MLEHKAVCWQALLAMDDVRLCTSSGGGKRVRRNLAQPDFKSTPISVEVSSAAHSVEIMFSR